MRPNHILALFLFLVTLIFIWAAGYFGVHEKGPYIISSVFSAAFCFGSGVAAFNHNKG